ncbi:MAG: hypothetical protein O7B99_03065 [Planctomycetota bacterium]|nr:hypothetical protein [Planctomycetota bacterium]
MEAGHESAGLDEKRLTMLRYVDKLTRTPGEMVREDVEALHAVGFGDEDILQIVETAGYYAYANRVADGLGVELERDGTEPGTLPPTSPETGLEPATNSRRRWWQRTGFRTVAFYSPR